MVRRTDYNNQPDHEVKAKEVGSTKEMGLARVRMSFDYGDVRDATNEELFLGLSLKLFEEVSEVTRAPHDTAEYGDVLTALQDFAELNGVAWEDVLRAQRTKGAERGGYLPGRLWLNKNRQVTGK